MAVEHVGPSRPAPQRERTRQVMECGSRLLAVGRSDRARYQTLERINIDLFRLNQEHVTARPAHDSVSGQAASEADRVAIERLSPSSLADALPKARRRARRARRSRSGAPRGPPAACAAFVPREEPPRRLAIPRPVRAPQTAYSGGMRTTDQGRIPVFPGTAMHHPARSTTCRGLDAQRGPNPFLSLTVCAVTIAPAVSVSARVDTVRHEQSHAERSPAIDQWAAGLGRREKGAGYGGVQRL